MSVIELLHDHGADMTLADQYGATPLHYAVQMCAQEQQQRDEDSNELDDETVDEVMRLDVLRAVLARTEITDLFDQQHRSPLIWAASCGNLHTLSI